MLNLLLKSNQSKERYVESIFDQYYPRLCDYAGRYLHDTEQAEDVVQDVFVTICERSEKLPVTELAIKSYLYVAVRNACFNKLRHLKVVNKHIDFQSKENQVHTPEVLESIIYSEVMAAMMEAIASLPQGCALIIRKSYLEGLSNNEIASELNISIHTVKSQKQRAISLLRDRLDPNLAGLILVILTSEINH